MVSLSLSKRVLDHLFGFVQVEENAKSPCVIFYTREDYVADRQLPRLACDWSQPFREVGRNSWSPDRHLTMYFKIGGVARPSEAYYGASKNTFWHHMLKYRLAYESFQNWRTFWLPNSFFVFCWPSGHLLFMLIREGQFKHELSYSYFMH